MRRTILAHLACLSALLAAPATAALSDFRLPDTSTSQPDSDRQGPVAPDVPESRGPAPTPAPTASRDPAPLPTPTAAPPRVVVPDLSGAAPAPARTRTPAATPTARSAPPPPLAQDAPAADVATSLPSSPVAATTPGQLPTVSSSTIAAPKESGAPVWPWVAAVLALGAIGFAGWTVWRRRPVSGPVGVPEIERPRLGTTPPPARPVPAAPTSALPEAAPSEPLQVTLEPLRLSLTLMNATLAYRLEIANRGAAPVTGLSVGADMIAAHASMSREQQLSGPGEGAATVQRIERIEPGESRIVEGEFRVPFSQIVPIRQGEAALLLPLARFRLAADGAVPVVRTFAVGETGPDAGLQPFRLDLGPRIYPRLTQRAFA